MSTATVELAARPRPGLHPRLAERGLLRRTGAGRVGYDRWLDHVASAGGCVRPIRLSGQLHTVEKATGRIVATRHTHDLPDGVVYVPCGDRRASVCPPCAETYRADTYQLIKAGLVGGKGVPETVREHPAVFATLTAPSFGPIHTRVLNPKTGQTKPCRIRRKIEVCPHGRLMSCTQRHNDTSPVVGRPLCLDCYDHSHHVVWNCQAGELWRRTMETLNKMLARLGKHYGTKFRASYGKVAEYQLRGTVHFHALIRVDQVDLDAPDDILAPPPAITPALLAQLVEHAIQATSFDTHPYPGTEHTWPIMWGRQVDIRPVTGMDNGAITAEAVAAYLAKYATKATEPAGLPVVRKLNAETAHHYSDPDTHLGRLIAFAWQLGDTPGALRAEQLEWLATHDPNAPESGPSPLDVWKKTYGRLRRWAHMLGFGGHFSTKSRRYSTTHKKLRAQRRAYQTTRRQNIRKRWDDHECDDDTTLIITELTLAGVGYHTTADAQLATAAAARAREQRQIAKEERLAS
jgi:hypothetical protein